MIGVVVGLFDECVIVVFVGEYVVVVIVGDDVGQFVVCIIDVFVVQFDWIDGVDVVGIGDVGIFVWCGNLFFLLLIWLVGNLMDLVLFSRSGI